MQFTPGERTGGFAAILELESNDVGDPVLQVDLSTFLGNSGTLLAHYPFDEDSATILYDHSGQGFHGRFIAENDASVSVSQTALASGSAVLFQPGEEDAAYAEVPRTVGLPTLTDFSVSLWFQPDPGAAGVSVLFSKGDALGDPFSLAFTGNSLLWVGNGQQADPFAEVVSEGPQHLVITVSEFETTLYLGGELIGAVASEPFDDSRASAFRIGALNGVFGFAGSMDDLQIYQSLLTPEEVQFLQTNPGQVIQGAAEPPSTGDFQIARLERTADSVTLTAPDLSGANLEIEYSETLVSDSWQVIGTWEDPTTPFVDSDADRATGSLGFYRVRQ